jgi:site-specific DNA-methyltransferase (cytosine-N4-specific)
MTSPSPQPLVGAIAPWFDENGVRIFVGDCREVLAALPADSANCCITSPPYWGLRGD